MKLSKFVNKYFLNIDKETVDLNYTVENINKGKDKHNLKQGDIILAYITTTVKVDGKKKRLNRHFDVYKLKDTYGKLTFVDFKGNEYKTSASGIKLEDTTALSYVSQKVYNLLDEHLKDIKKEEIQKFNDTVKEFGFSFNALSPEDKLESTIKSGIKNIWMVGPAGCGKSTIARNIASEMNLPYLCISCGIGTSAAEFVGYKYPTREATRFSEFYSIPSVILIDEMTALDPAVAQVLNSALANDEIETTTGIVKRHNECIIIATSNTFGNGCDRQYVANNQLDSSTIDRFVGGIIEVGYSSEYEQQFDEEVVSFANDLRRFIKENDIRKLISTRFIQAGHKLKMSYIQDWKNLLITNWSFNEKQTLKEWASNNNIDSIKNLKL